MTPWPGSAPQWQDTEPVERPKSPRFRWHCLNLCCNDPDDCRCDCPDCDCRYAARMGS